MANAFSCQKWFSLILIWLVVFPCPSKSESERSNVDFTILNIYEKDMKNQFSWKTVEIFSSNIIELGFSMKNKENVCEQILKVVQNDILHQSVILFDSSQSDDMKTAIRKVAEQLKLPTLSYSYRLDALDDSNNENSYYVPILPPSHFILDMVKAIVRAFEMDGVAVFYDPTINFDSKYKLLENTDARHYYIFYEYISTNATAIHLENARKSDIFNYFLMGSSEWILNFFGAAESTQNATYFRKNFSWILLLTDVQVNEKEKFIRDLNSTFSSLPSPANRTMYLAFPNGSYFYDDAQFFYSLLQSASELSSTFLTTNLSEMTCDSTSRPGTEDNWPSFRTQFLELPHYIYNSTKTMVEIVKIVDFDLENASVFESSGVYEIMEKIGITKPVKLYRVSVALQTPFVMYSNVSGNYSGYSVDLLDKLAERLNFEYEILFRHDHFGHMAPDSSWDKVMGDLVDRRADIGLGSMSVTAEREAAIDFTVPYFDLVGITILMKRSEPERRIFRFLSVLEMNVWLCILAAFFTTSFLMWIFDKLSRYHRHCSNSNDPDCKRLFDLKECLWFCVTSLTPQGGGEAPKCLSSKIVAGTWWLFGFVIVASYTANLAAFFTKARLVSTVESLDELSNQYRITYAPINNSDEMIFFKRMKDIEKTFNHYWTNVSLNDSLTPFERAKYAVWEYPVATKYTKLWEAMEKTTFPNNISEAVERVEGSTSGSGFAFLGDATDINYLIRNNCQFQVIGEEFSRKPYAIGIQQGSPLKYDFDEALLNLLSTRWLEERKRDWWPKRTCDNEAHFDGIHFTYILGFFVVIVCGISMAVVALATEYLSFRYRKVRLLDNDCDESAIHVTPKSVMSVANQTVTESEQQNPISGGRRRRNSNVAFE